MAHQVEGDAGQDERLELLDRHSSLQAQLSQRALARDQLADDGGRDAQHCAGGPSGLVSTEVGKNWGIN